METSTQDSVGSQAQNRGYDALAHRRLHLIESEMAARKRGAGSALACKLARDWGKLNGMRLTKSSFGLKTLAEGKRLTYIRKPFPMVERDYDSGLVRMDHCLCYRWPGGKSAAIVTQPYSEPEDISRVGHAVRARGLTIHMLPNPWASFHYPNGTIFVVLMRSEDGAPRWLRDQLAFASIEDLIG